MSQENVDLVRRAFEAFDRGDFAALGLLLTPGAEIVPMRAAVEGTSFTGPDAAEQFMAATDETWSRLRVEIDEVRDLGERTLVLGWVNATARGTGAEVKDKVGWVVSFRGGKIAEIRTYPVQSEALEAVGLSE